MRTHSVGLSLLAAVIPTILAGDAPVVTGEPYGASYIATLPNTTTTVGSVQISTNSNGTGVLVQVALAGLQSEGGHFCERRRFIPNFEASC